MTLFATSNTVREEGLPRGFRVYFGYAERPCLLPAQHLIATDLIQDLELHIDLGGARARPYRCDPVRHFGGNDTNRQSCRIFLDYGGAGYISERPGYFARSSLFTALRTLSGFELVTVKLLYTSEVVVPLDAHDWQWYKESERGVRAWPRTSDILWAHRSSIFGVPPKCRFHCSWHQQGF